MQHLWLIPTFPLLGFLINGLFGKRFSKPLINAIAVGAPVLSFLWVLKSLMALWGLEEGHLEHYFTWFESGALNVGADFYLDRLTAVMLLVVTGIGSLIHVYATGYMSHEEGYYRFFAYLNLFMFFMLVLVLGANCLILFVGWEGVGLCSYLLIGFYITKKSAGDAAKKAFIVNRIGDFGFTLAMFLIVVQFGSLAFDKVFPAAAAMPIETSAGILTGIGLLLLVGATGKSAQIPLYVWLPDAMEGPTPVSALIHAATMVTAGVYMTARSAAIYTNAPIALEVIAWIGLATALFAATIGLTQNDIKKVFAYSTVSQLGFMFLAVGVGAFSAGIFHLVTHAYFKALLFLGAGSVIHGLHNEQDIRNMGGLRSKMPITFLTLMAAGLAISGFPFTSGFFSKDEILVAAYHHNPILFWVGTFTAGLTAFYVFRALFLTFFGKYRGHAHPHESPPSMWVPLAVLAVLSLIGGFISIPHFLEPLFPIDEVHHENWLVFVASSAGLIGIALAYLFYVVNPALPERVKESAGGFYDLVYNKYFVDEAYDAAIVRPLVSSSRGFFWRGVDVGLIDGSVNGMGNFARGIGNGLRRMQGGNIRNYATWVLIGSVIIIFAVGMAGGLR